jgi:hypothetical protein
MPNGNGDDAGGKRPQATTAPLWFLDDPDALLRRLIVRTVLEPPPGMRRVKPRWLKR